MASTMPDVSTDGAPTADSITMYGADWCGDTRRSKALLTLLGVPYAFVDVDQDAAASAWAARQNGGRRRIPTIALGLRGSVLVEPSDDELAAALRDAGLV